LGFDDPNRQRGLGRCAAQRRHRSMIAVVLLLALVLAVLAVLADD
jgi:hypothetical protein